MLATYNFEISGNSHTTFLSEYRETQIFKVDVAKHCAHEILVSEGGAFNWNDYVWRASSERQFNFKHLIIYLACNTSFKQDAT